jgi:two-component system nitrogen regulation sensor histidine kinase GlnL
MSDHLYATIVEHQAAALVLINSEQRIEFMNVAAETMFNVSLNRSKNELFSSLLARGEHTLLELIAESFQSVSAWSERELALSLSNNNEITVACSINPLLADGEHMALVELNSLDRQLKITKDSSLIQEHKAAHNMVRGLAHEIKNPLGGLRGAAQLLENELNDPELVEYTKIIIKEADRLHKLVDQMLGPNMVPNKQYHNIHEVLQHVLGLTSIETAQSITLRFDYDPSIPEIKFDRDLLVQAVLNITRNAIRALDGNGMVMFKTRVLRRHTIASKLHKLVACISIIDNGPGVPEDIKNDIFFPMVSGQSDGSGLGLAISQMLINRHNGLIEFDSEPGETEFRILLPIDVH